MDENVKFLRKFMLKEVTNHKLDLWNIKSPRIILEKIINFPNGEFEEERTSAFWYWQRIVEDSEFRGKNSARLAATMLLDPSDGFFYDISEQLEWFLNFIQECGVDGESLIKSMNDFFKFSD